MKTDQKLLKEMCARESRYFVEAMAHKQARDAMRPAPEAPEPCLRAIRVRPAPAGAEFPVIRLRDHMAAAVQQAEGAYVFPVEEVSGEEWEEVGDDNYLFLAQCGFTVEERMELERVLEDPPTYTNDWFLKREHQTVKALERIYMVCRKFLRVKKSVN